MIYNDDKIKKDKDYYKLVLVNHLLLYYMPISRIAYNNWKVEILDFNFGFILLITISLIIVLRTRYKSKKHSKLK